MSSRISRTPGSLWAPLIALWRFSTRCCRSIRTRRFYGDSELIVWPSNEQLIRRANGMSPATLRRHLAVLVDCGLIIRRDSPNGKRFARKGQGGEIEQAYGFDLSPIVARAEEFKDLAEAVRAEKKAFRLVKERLTICRRDIVKMIDAGIEEGVPANWGRVQQAYQAIVGRIPRTAPRQVLEAIAEELEDLWAEVREALESFVKTQNLNANESQIERHIQNSKPDSKSESESGLGNKDEAGANVADTDNVRSLPKRELPLGIVLDACPNMLWLVKGGGEIRNWREFLAAAEVARPSWGSARAPGRRRERQWASSRRRSPLPRSTSGRTRSTAPAAICAA